MDVTLFLQGPRRRTDRDRGTRLEKDNYMGLYCSAEVEQRFISSDFGKNLCNFLDSAATRLQSDVTHGPVATDADNAAQSWGWGEVGRFLEE